MRFFSSIFFSPTETTYSYYYPVAFSNMHTAIHLTLEVILWCGPSQGILSYTLALLRILFPDVPSKKEQICIMTFHHGVREGLCSGSPDDLIP